MEESYNFIDYCYERIFVRGMKRDFEIVKTIFYVAGWLLHWLFLGTQQFWLCFC